MAAKSRTPVMAGNWKMFKTAAQTVQFLDEFKPLVAQAAHCEVVICPAFTALTAATDNARGSNVHIGAQNLHWEVEGAFTGEISGPMIKAAGCSHVIIGHSERRQYFGETDATVNKRTFAALKAGLTPIVCVGETLEEREGGKTETILIQQLEGGLAALTGDDFSRIIIAYEPVWAIGTGRVATPEIAAEAHAVIRQKAAQLFGLDLSAQIRVLYGGSVKPDNVEGLMAKPDIDGALVGGASLKPDSFGAIVNYSGR